MAKNGRPGLPRSVQAVFWDGVRAGLGVGEAGLAAGVGSNLAKVWFRQAGGVKANGPGRVSGRYLSVAEREEIAVGVAVGQPVRAIAARLGRDPFTVSREVRRNGCRGRYRALAAQAQAEFRARRPKTAKLAGNARLRGWVQERLEERWSPEQISVMLRREFRGRAGDVGVARDDLPVDVRAGPGGAAAGAGGLPAHRAGAARPRRRQGERRGRIKDMVMISERPAEVADRAVPGHWEGDLIIGTRPARRSAPWWSGPPGSCCCCTCPAGTTPSAVRGRAGRGDRARCPRSCAGR